MTKEEAMRLWNQLSKTDPNHAKPVQLGARRFTSIDAQWQIMRMTEVLGPVGQGWGYDTVFGIENLNEVQPGLVVAWCDVTLWVMDDSKNVRRHWGPVRGSTALVETNRQGRSIYDDDAFKKCMTDALTKGLSHLGVSADVFLGLYDDNKYVTRLKQEFGDAKVSAEHEGVKLPLQVELMQKAITACNNLKDLEAKWAECQPVLKTFSEPHRNLMIVRARERRSAIEGAALRIAGAVVDATDDGQNR